MAIILGDDDPNLLRGTRRDDFIFGFDDDDRLLGNEGDDRLYGGDDHDQLFGGTGDDDLFSGRDGDRIWGQAGRDQLEGEGGHDRLNGGGGADKLEGGTGEDRFIFGRGSGKDTIDDFDRDEDVIDLRAYANISFEDLVLDTTTHRGDTTIDLGLANGGAAGVNVLKVEDVTDLSSADFLLA